MTVLARVEEYLYRNRSRTAPTLDGLGMDGRWFLVLGVITLAACVFMPSAQELVQSLGFFAVICGGLLYRLKKDYPIIYGLCEYIVAGILSVVHLLHPPLRLTSTERLLFFFGVAYLIRSGIESANKGFEKHEEEAKTKAAPI